MNNVSGQTGFALQAPAAGLYRAGAGLQFPTIQAAIDQAVADGHTTADNLAIVEVYPGTYPENLVLKSGVSLTNFEGIGTAPNADGSGGSVRIVGNVTYAPVAGTLAQNAITVNNINMSVLNGIALAFGGTAPARLTLSALSVQKQVGGDANPVVQITNAGGVQLRCQNNTTIIMGVAAVTAMDIQQGAVEMKDRLTQVMNTSGGTIASAAKLSNTASLMVSYCQLWFNGAATAMVELANAAALFQFLHSTFSVTNVGGHGVLYTAAGIARFRWSQLQVNANLTGYLGKDGGGGVGASWVQNGALSIIGANRQVQIPIAITTDAASGVPTA